MLTIGSKKEIRQIIKAGSIVVVLGSVLSFIGSVLILSQQNQYNLNTANKLEVIKTNELLKLKSDEIISNAKSNSSIAKETNTLIIRGVNNVNLFKEARVNLESLNMFNDGLGISITDQNRTIIGTYNGSQVCQFNSKVCLILEKKQ